MIVGRPKSELLIRDAASAWLHSLQHRKRNPCKPATLATFGSYVAKWIDPIVGSVPVVSFGNKEMRDFVSRLAANDLSAKTITEVSGALKQVIASVVHPETGDALHPRTWNSTFIDLPVVTEQHQPSVSTQELEHAIANASSEPDAALYALAAGSGARIGELLALRIGPSDVSSCWGPDTGSLTIRTSLWRGHEQAPKTDAAHRTIELAEPLNAMLKDFAGKRTGFLFGNGLPLKESTARAHLDKALPARGFHAFRRYRCTWLRGARCPEDVTRYWLGHSDGASITNRYSKLADDVALRRKLADEIGTGFTIPGETR